MQAKENEMSSLRTRSDTYERHMAEKNAEIMKRQGEVHDER